MITWLGNLRIRLVGGSLLTRTVVTVAAFTMTTCLLLGLFSMAAVGATRAIVGGAPPGDPSELEGAAVAVDEEGSEKGDTSEPTKTGAKAKASARTGGSKSSAAKARRTGAARPGGAMAPADALRSAGRGDEEGGS